MSNNQQCIFCHCLKGHLEHAQKLLPGTNSSKFIIDQTDHLFLTYELFPISQDPYFLIISKKHITSFSQIKNNVDPEMSKLIKKIIRVHNKKNIIIFEHGEQSHGRKAQSIYHAHTHLILSNQDYFGPMQQELTQIKVPSKILKFDDWPTQTTLKQYAGNQSYLFFRQNNLGLLISRPDTLPVYSQFFRKLLSKIENQYSFVSWKNYNHQDIKTIRARLTSTMNSTHDD